MRVMGTLWYGGAVRRRSGFLVERVRHESMVDPASIKRALVIRR
jgi:hypothetical protein